MRLQQHGQVSSQGNDSQVSGLLASTGGQMQTPVSQAGFLSVLSGDTAALLELAKIVTAGVVSAVAGLFE